MIEYLAAILAGLIFLVWSADRFVAGSAGIAGHYRVPPLLIGMVIVGFGTSAPEMLVSVSASIEGNSGIALGNAYGSNIANIAIILGIAALICPIKVNSSVLKKELPWLLLVTVLSAILLIDLNVSRWDAIILLLVFSGFMVWTIRQGIQKPTDPLAEKVSESQVGDLSLRHAVLWLLTGLIVLVLSARLLVWGAVNLAGFFGVSDLVIGLTIVAIGTSLPELASSVMAARRGAHEIALGNVLGSNIFNTLAVVGLAGIIQPLSVEAVSLYRDIGMMLLLTVVLFVFAFGFKKPGRINRLEGTLLLTLYVGYSLWLLYSV